MLTQGLYERLVGDQALFIGAAAQDDGPVLLHHIGKLTSQAGLPYAWLAAEEDHLPLAVVCSLPSLSQASQISLAPDEMGPNVCIFEQIRHYALFPCRRAQNGTGQTHQESDYELGTSWRNTGAI